MEDFFKKMSQLLNIQIIKTNRSSLSLEVNQNADVIIRAPQRLSDTAIQGFIQKKWFWLNTHILMAKKRLAVSKAAEQNILTLNELNCLAAKAKEIFKLRVAHYAPIIGVSYKKITIRSQISRWGSCSAKGNLNFNCLLLLAPKLSLDYVVIHELCHRKEMNHSKKFWALVEKAMPDYKIHKQWLKDNGNALISRLGKI